MATINEDFVTKLIRETKEKILAQGGAVKPTTGCCAAGPTTAIKYEAGGPAPKPRQERPTAEQVMAAAEALGVKFNGGSRVNPEAATPERLQAAAARRPMADWGPGAPQRRVERVIPGIPHNLRNGVNGLQYRYSHRALEKLIRADLTARGVPEQVEIQFDELGAAVTTVA